MCNFGNFSAHLPCDKRKLYSQFKVCTLVVVFACIRNANSRYADGFFCCGVTRLDLWLELRRVILDLTFG